MKNFIYLLIAVIFISCGDKRPPQNPEMKVPSGIYTTPETKVVEIEFKEGESPYFGVSMQTGSANDRIVWFAFYKASDIEGNVVKQGATPCRYYQVALPYGEVAEHWGYGPITTRTADGRKHTIEIKLVNQPE